MSKRYPNNAIDIALANLVRAMDQAFSPEMKSSVASMSDPYAKVGVESEVSND